MQAGEVAPEALLLGGSAFGGHTLGSVSSFGLRDIAVARSSQIKFKSADSMFKLFLWFSMAVQKKTLRLANLCSSTRVRTVGSCAPCVTKRGKVLGRWAVSAHAVRVLCSVSCVASGWGYAALRRRRASCRGRAKIPARDRLVIEQSRRRVEARRLKANSPGLD